MCACELFGGHFRERTKIQQKRPKFAGPIYFHAEVYLEDILLESVRKSNKKGPNLPARFIFTRMYVWKFAKRIFVAVFTNFAATLARQPSAASLAPRLNYFVAFLTESRTLIIFVTFVTILLGFKPQNL